MSEPPIEGFKALAHPLRYRILEVLVDGERNVGEIEQASGIAQPGLSQQLAILRKADLVESRREAKQVYYAIAQGNLSELHAAIGRLLPGDPQPPSQRATARQTGAAVFARLNI